ncbi:MAG: aldehyde dehydrogenase family protein [Myxococcales bacterium]|nr:aldehyde dehydrogenase family protein [Myxococcales bacterium]
MSERRKTGAERRRPGADLEPGSEPADPLARLAVKKTWKMYVGGAFVRSESGRYLVTADGVDNYPWASRKDGRDAVTAAQAAQKGWAGKTAYNRGQILYRLGEVMEGRRAELALSLERAGESQPEREVDAAIDRAISFAGWSDKYQSLFASSNPVAGPHFGFSVTDPMGVVVIAAPDRPALLGLVGSICPVIVSGNVAVVVVSEVDPITPLILAECLATSDLPGGVVNLLTGKRAEVLPHLAKHMGVRALDLWDLTGDDAVKLEVAAADNVKRVTRRSLELEAWYDETRGGSPGNIERFLETKTVWHPMGA